MSWQIAELSDAFSNIMFSASEEILKAKCSVYLSSQNLYWTQKTSTADGTGKQPFKF